MKHRLSFVYFFLPFIIVAACTEEPYKKNYREAYDHLSHKEVEDIEQALDQFNEVIVYTLKALDGKSSALRALGHKLIQAKMYLEAAECFEKARKIEPTNANIYYYLGLCYANYARITQNPREKKKYLHLAEETYLSGREANPSNASIFYALGILYGFLKADPKKGIQYLDHSLSLEEQNVKCMFALGNLQYRIGNTVSAERHYKNILDLVEKDSQYVERVRENLKILHRERKE